jgi:hypothetical protein
MKVRLQIVATPDLAFPFEHGSPVVRIGRDPACELSLQGEASRSVSWQHARLDLTTAGASVTDLQSSNGTLVNGQRIDGTAPVRVGDRIQLGFTGPTMTVVELDLVPAVPAARPAAPIAPPVVAADRSATPLYLGIGGALAAACLLVLVGFVIFRPKDDGPQALKGEPPSTQQTQPGPSSTRPASPPTKPDPAPPPTPPPPIQVGQFDKPPKSPPSVLLRLVLEGPERNKTWIPLKPNDPVPALTTLVSLPGYRSTILLDTHVQLTLWGDLPQFNPSSAVRESAVELQFPGPGIDLDFTLDRGRVHLATSKDKDAAQVQIRFMGETWKLALPRGSEVCVERIAVSRRGDVREVVGLFTKGTANLKTTAKEYTLPDRSYIFWESGARQVSGPNQLPAGQPDWWTMKLEFKTAAAQDARDALIEWEKTITREPDKVVSNILTGTQESAWATDRTLGTLFLGALEEIELLVVRLLESRHREVRVCAADVLGHWLARSREHQAEFLQFLRRGRYASDVADLIVRLLHDPPEMTAPQLADYKRELLAYLEHTAFLVRELAHQQLCVLVPEGINIKYEASGEPPQRLPAVEQWKKLISAG